MTVVKVDIDIEGNGELIGQYELSGVPTLIYVKDG